MRRHRSGLTLALTVALAGTVAGLFLLGACSDSNGDSGSSDAKAGRLKVVAAFYPMADAVAKVGGQRVEVTNLTPVGAEPHDIELSPKQVDEIENADVVVYLGKGFQPAVAETASRHKKGRLDVLDGIQLDKGDIEAIEAEEDGGSATPTEGDNLDPHFWLDPTLMGKAVAEITDALAAASPADADAFRANAQRYHDQLSALDAEFKRGLASCDRKDIVTSHAAFFYLAHRYGLNQLPIAGLSPESEPDADRIATLTDEIKAKGITTVFYEELVSPKVSGALAREAGVKTAVLSPIEGLSKDEIKAGKDYAAVMRDNLAALRQALGCR
jgi:zinc transport system substrate-binding protein